MRQCRVPSARNGRVPFHVYDGVGVRERPELGKVRPQLPAVRIAQQVSIGSLAAGQGNAAIEAVACIPAPKRYHDRSSEIPPISYLRGDLQGANQW
jgi:hypothetical protein